MMPTTVAMARARLYDKFATAATSASSRDGWANNCLGRPRAPSKGRNSTRRLRGEACESTGDAQRTCEKKGMVEERANVLPYAERCTCVTGMLLKERRGPATALLAQGRSVGAPDDLSALQ